MVQQLGAGRSHFHKHTESRAREREREKRKWVRLHTIPKAPHPKIYFSQHPKRFHNLPKEQHQLGSKCSNPLAYVDTFLSKLAYSQLHWLSCFNRRDCYHSFPAMKLWIRIKPSILMLFRCGYSFTGLRKVTSKPAFQLHSEFYVYSGHAFLMDSRYFDPE